MIHAITEASVKKGGVVGARRRCMGEREKDRKRV
jgi:hypothetical protein